MAPADEVVEREANDRPGHVVERGRGRDGASATEDDGEVNVLDERVRPLERDEPPGEGRGSTQEEEEHKAAINPCQEK